MQMIISKSNHQPIRAYMLSYHGKNLHACMRRHSTCPKYRVNLRPTTQCKCQWEINTESVPIPISQLVVYVILFNRFVSFWATELFGVSPRVFYTLRHFSGFHRWILCLTRFSGFSPEGGIYPLLLRLTHFIFHFRLTLWNSIGLRPIPKPTQFNTKRSAKLVP